MEKNADLSRVSAIRSANTQNFLATALREQRRWEKQIRFFEITNSQKLQWKTIFFQTTFQITNSQNAQIGPERKYDQSAVSRHGDMMTT